MSRRRSVSVGAALGLVALVLGILHSGLAGRALPTADASVPAFALSRLDDPRQALSGASLRGQAVVMHFWASWCVACRDEQPLLLSLARDEGVALYGLNHRDRREDALRWLAFYGDPYHVSLSDPDGRFGEALGVRALPATLVVDARGAVRYRHSGALRAEDWRREIAPLLRRLDAERAS